MTQDTLQVTSSAVSDRGLSEKRPQNEDSYLEMPERGLFAVADGVGGAQAGDVASQMAVEILGEAFTNLREGGDVEELMEIAITRANGAIFQMSNDLPQLSTMATTIVTLHIKDNIATIGHVGDSRLYRIDPKGNLYRETQDHSMVEEEVRAGRMTREQAEHHPSKNVISRALGAESTVEIDMKTIMFDPNTTFLLCSDGITRHIPDTEIRELLALPHAPVDICQQMREICYSRGAEDNLTAVIVRIAGQGAEDEHDFEENTISTPRPPLVNSAIFASGAQHHAVDVADDDDEMPTRNLQIPPGYQEQVQGGGGQMSFSAAPAAAETVPAAAIAPVAPVATSSYSTSYPDQHEKPKSGGGILGTIITAILCLAIGFGAGAAAIYAYLASQTPKEVPQINTPKTTDISLTSFESARRSVDNQPEQYIASSREKADDAEDFCLLGRAYLLTGKTAEAKEAYVKAKAALDKASVENKAILANEIAIGNAIIDSPVAVKALETARKPAQTEPANNR